MTRDPNTTQDNPSIGTRIIEHMNLDHADALMLYARVFGCVEGATGARMRTIDRTAMTIEYDHPDGSGVVRIAFDPPMGDLTEARPRLVALVAEARRALGAEK